MQENKDNRQKRAEWVAKERALIEKLKKPEDKTLRWKGLLRAALVGLPFFLVFDFVGLTRLIGGAGDSVGRASVNLFFVSLPTLTLLWWFRTYDARQQIQKTQESINANLFGIYIRMLFSEESGERSGGILGLIGMKKKGLFVEEIDTTTQQNLNLAKANLKNKDLSGLNFSNANFTEAVLSGSNLSNCNLFNANLSAANLSGAKLKKANLKKACIYYANEMTPADLSDADLSGADLSGANLMGAILTRADLTGANLKNAEYSKGTKFPDGFDPESAEMIFNKDIND